MLGVPASVPMRIPLLILVLLNVAAAVLVAGGRDGAAISASPAVAPPSAAGPARIIPCSAAAADWVALLVPPERVAALPEQVARYSILGDAEAWSSTPRFAAVEAESLLARSPDLVLVSRFTTPATVHRIEEAGLEVVVVVEPGSWEGILEAGRQVAEVTGTLDAWPGVAASLEERRAALAALHPDPAPRVLPYGNYGTENFTSGAGATIDLALRLAGCENHAATLGIEGPGSISVEQILAEPFDWFLMGGSAPDNPSTRALRSNGRLAELEPVQNERFLTLSSALYSSGSHTILDAAEVIAESLASDR